MNFEHNINKILKNRSNHRDAFIPLEILIPHQLKTWYWWALLQWDPRCLDCLQM